MATKQRKTQKLMHFRLLTSTHNELVLDKNGNTVLKKYKKGQKVSSYKNLKKIFKNKFAIWSENQREDADETEDIDEDKVRRELEEELEEAQADDTEDNDEEEDLPQLSIIGKGRGKKYQVVNEDNDPIHDGMLTKKQAEQMIQDYGFKNNDDESEESKDE